MIKAFVSRQKFK